MFDALVMLVGSLDSLPNMGRLFLSAALLAVALGLVDRRIAPANAALGVSYRKSALLALLIIPALTHLVVGVRLVLLVEELPVFVPAPDYLWWLLLAAWLGGAGYHGRNALLRLRHPAVEVEDLDDKLTGRFEHWCNRLSVHGGQQLALGNVALPLNASVFGIRIVLPRAVAHWPIAAQDLLITRELCYGKRRVLLWSVVGDLVAALYWPIPWVKDIARGLNDSLEQSCNRLAMFCFNDRLGYERASKQLEQRLESADAQPMPTWEAEEISVGARNRYRVRSQRKDPQYDRVFWSLVQATVVVFILTGATLRQLEVFDPEAVDLSERWFFSYERSADYSDKEVESVRKRAW